MKHLTNEQLGKQFLDVFGHLDLTPDDVSNWIIKLQDEVTELKLSKNWAENPDRSGGQSTQHEINNANKW